jgi:tetratricopeptide (TPR) repeat protein
MNLAIAHGIVDDYCSAHVSFLRARSHFEEVGDLARLAELHFSHGMMALAKGALTEALRDFETVADLSANCSQKKPLGLACLGKAHVCFARRNTAMAIMYAQQAQECFSLRDDQPWLADVYKMKGIICRRQKHYSFALWYLYTSARINRDSGDSLSSASCDFELGKLFAERGMRKQAQQAFSESLRVYKQLGAKHDAARADQELKRLRNQR